MKFFLNKNEYKIKNWYAYVPKSKWSQQNN